MRFGTLLLISALAQARSPSANPQYDLNDPEGMVRHENGWSRFAWKRKGTWTATPLHNPFGRTPGATAATPAELKQMTAALDALSALLRATPEGGDPRGYFMKESRTYEHFNFETLPPGIQGARQPVIYSTGYFPFYIADTLKNGNWVQDAGGETESVYFYFNRLPERTENTAVAKEILANGERLEFYLRPDLSVKYMGFPVVDGQVLMITRGGRDPWAAVPYGRALKAAMGEYEKDLATAQKRLEELKQKEAGTQLPAYEKQMRDQLEKYYGSLRTSSPAKWTSRLTAMERELAYNRELARKQANPQRDGEGNWYWHPLDVHADAKRRLESMTAEEAARPAGFLKAENEQGRYAIQGKILPTGADPRCRELAMTNYAYFDPKLPRTAPQILLVRNLGRCAKVVNGKLEGPQRRPSIFPPQGCHRHVPIWEAMDWAKVAALLAP